jgi:hypothetical protein
MMNSEVELKRDEAMLAWTKAARMANEAWAKARVAKQVAMNADRLEEAARLDMQQKLAEWERWCVNEVQEKFSQRGGGEV